MAKYYIQTKKYEDGDYGEMGWVYEDKKPHESPSDEVIVVRDLLSTGFYEVVVRKQDVAELTEEEYEFLVMLNDEGISLPESIVKMFKAREDSE